jgi:hypothetical protein
MTLTFDDELGARHFEFCFVGLILGGSLQEKKGLSILRTEMALFGKLETISDLRPCGKKLVNGEPDRQLKNGEGTKQLQMTPQEHDLLYHYIAQVPWQAGTPGRHALETLDWLAQRREA